MSEIIKGVITSRNTIIEETQGPSDNNINNISSYQEKTILTLEDGSHYSTHLKVDAQCGDKVILLVNSETLDIETIFDKNNYEAYKQKSFDKGHFFRLGSLSFALNVGAFSLIYGLSLNPQLGFHMPNIIMIMWFTISLLVSLGMATILVNSNEARTIKDKFNEEDFQDFFSEVNIKENESISKTEMLKI